jgi:hypothetical protein
MSAPKIIKISTMSKIAAAVAIRTGGKPNAISRPIRVANRMMQIAIPLNPQFRSTGDQQDNKEQ